MPDIEPAAGRRVLRATASNFAGRFVTLGISLAMIPFVLGHLGPSRYGMWVLVGSVVAYASLLDFGIGGAVVKYVAEYSARGEADRARSLIATALRVYCALGILAVTMGVAFAPLFPSIFNIPEAEHGTAVWLVMGMGLALGISIPATIAMAVLQGLQRYDLMNLVGVLNSLATAVLTVAVLLAGGGLLSMVAVSIVVAVLTPVLSVWLLRRVAPNLRVGWSGATRKLVAPMLSFSAALFVNQSAGRLKTKTDEIVIAAFLPVSAVAPYAISRRPADLTLSFARQFTRVLMPLSSELEAREDWTRVRSLYVDGSRITLAICLPIATILIVLAESVLTVWVGSAYAEFGYLVVILTLSTLIDVAQWPAGAILQGIGRYRLPALISAASAVVNLALSVILIRPFGLAGVALGTLIPTAAESLAFLLPYSLRTLGVSSRRMLLEVWWPAVLPMPAMMVVLFGLRAIADPSHPFLLFVAGFVSCVVYAAVYAAFSASDDERRLLRGATVAAAAYLQARLRGSEVSR